MFCLISHPFLTRHLLKIITFSHVKAKTAVSTIFLPSGQMGAEAAAGHMPPRQTALDVERVKFSSELLLHGGKYALIQLPKCLNGLAS